MISYIKEYGVMAFLIIVLILEIVIMAIKRKPKTLDDFLTILHEVAANYVPSMIREVERPSDGSNKKSQVIDGAYKLVKRQIGRDLSKKEYEVFKSYISDEIEMILMTPTKKGA